MFVCSVILVIAFMVLGSFEEKLSSIENEQIHQVCGPYKKLNNKVMYGTRMDPSEAPWVVPIAVFRQEGVMYCSGTLVSSRHVITARHCFVRDYHQGKGFTYVFNEQRIDLGYCSGKDYLIPSGMSEAELYFATECRDREACESINLSPNLVTRKTAKVVLPGICAYNGRDIDAQDDFAIIELDKDVLFSEKIHPICIPSGSNGLYNGANVTIFGFGFDPSDMQVSTGILKYESSFMLPCSYRSAKYVCSMSYNGRQLACKGDSGGGVVYVGETHSYLVAILSRGEACRLSGRRYLGDILAPVYIYLKEICKYTGICRIEADIRKSDVSRLYGHEAKMASTSMVANYDDEDTELLTCPVCQEEYDEETMLPYIIDCGHTMCGECIAKMKSRATEQGQTVMNCPTCREPCNRATAPKNFKLAEAISVIKKLRTKPDAPENPVKCKSCSKIDNESDMFVCRNCINDAFGYDIIGSKNTHEDLDFRTVAQCGSCAIRDHVSLGHDTTPYFPISSAKNFESQLTSFIFLLEELDQRGFHSDEKYAGFRHTRNLFRSEFNKMMEMARKSKSTTVQQEFFRRIEAEIGIMSKHVEGIQNAISKSEAEYKEKLEKLMILNRTDETSKCCELPERQSELFCSQCKRKQTAERFLCCQTCFEVVKLLSEDELDSSKFDAIDIDTLPICSNCTITNHIGENHQTVRFAEIQAKHRCLQRIVEVDRKKNAVTGQFAGLRDTFKHYTGMIDAYEKNIEKMSQFVFKNRGHPGHDEMIEGLQTALTDAEHAIAFMLSNAEINNKSTNNAAPDSQATDA